MPAAAPVVVKLGGSLMTGANLSVLLDAIAAARRPVAIVCGGGLFADAVRAAQHRLGFSEGLAHRLALDAMGHFAEFVAELRPTFRLAAAPAEVWTALAAGAPVLWQPAALRAGDPAIPESWAVTSDSLALHLAAGIGAAALLLVKSAEPSPGADLDGLIGRGYLDQAFPAFLAGYSGIVRLLGPADHRRLGQAIGDPAAAIGTELRRARD
ncbi:amino acid kinase family protein [Prosthecomicrobium sp. N25]|uniref:amino acid kinase family protein n=1 Tax=Prosthecomicrobium sp. N25 TaxID=3129254 RepID=UPI00307877E2